jgi:hypothetical protein
VKEGTKLGTNLKVTRGEVIVLTQGEYSDFGIDSFAVALQDFDMGGQAREYAKETGKDSYQNGTWANVFIPWMVIKQLIMPVEYREIYIGTYGTFEPDFGVAKP